MVDVRSLKEYYTREILVPPEYPTEHAERGAYIAGRMNISWSYSVNEVCTFKSVEELEKLYHTKRITPDKEVIARCRIGEWSSLLTHTHSLS